MKSTDKYYTIGYFFTIEHSKDAERFVEYMLRSLRTQDPTAPEGNQPRRVEEQPHCVAFLEHVNQAQLAGLHNQVQAVVVSVFAAFEAFNDQMGDSGKIGATIYVREDQEPKRRAALFAEVGKDAGTTIAFAYQTDIVEGTVLTPDSVTYVPSGKDAIDSLLAFFGELKNGTGKETH